MSALFHQYLINDSREGENSMLLTIAAQTGDAAENVNDCDNMNIIFTNANFEVLACAFISYLPI